MKRLLTILCDRCGLQLARQAQAGKCDDCHQPHERTTVNSDQESAMRDALTAEINRQNTEKQNDPALQSRKAANEALARLAGYNTEENNR